MIEDPIANEIRQRRRAYAERFNASHAICEALRERVAILEFRIPSQALSI